MYPFPSKSPTITWVLARLKIELAACGPFCSASGLNFLPFSTDISWINLNCVICSEITS